MFIKQKIILGSVIQLTVTTVCTAEEKVVVSPLATEPVGVGNYVQMLLGLIVVLGVIVALAWLLKRMGNFQSSASGIIKVIAAITVGQRERVVLMQVGETQLLVGITPGQIRTLHVLEQAIVPGDIHETTQGGFAEKLNAILMQGKRK